MSTVALNASLRILKIPLYVRPDKNNRLQSNEIDNNALTESLVAPLVIKRLHVQHWRAKLRRALRAATLEDVEAIVSAIIKGKKRAEWKRRLQRELNKMDKLCAVATGPIIELVGNTIKGPGRAVTFYPQLNERMFVQTLSKQTRSNLFGDYVELDLAAAHLFVAFGCVVLEEGYERSKEIVPCLWRIVNNKNEARNMVAYQNSCQLEDAKRKINVSLNKLDVENQSDFLRDLCAERKYWLPSVERHPKVCSAIDAIRTSASQAKSKTDVRVRYSSLLLQHLENAAMLEAIDSLNGDGFEIGAIIADGILVRRKSGDVLVADAAKNAEQTIYKNIGIKMKLEIELTR